MRFEFWRFDFRRLDLTGLRDRLAALPRVRVDLTRIASALGGMRLLSAKTAVATGSALVAAGTVLYVTWPRPADLPVDAVVSTAAPVFTPVTWKPAGPAPSASKPSYDGEPGRAIDMRDPNSVTRAVQRRLKEAQCYEGRVNGIWNAATRRGMAAFTEIVNARLPVDRADPVLLVLLETHKGVTCAKGTPASARGAPREEVASTERETPEGNEPQSIAAVEEAPAESAASWPAEGAAAVAAAASAHKVAKADVAKPDRPRAKRKYRRGPSFSRSFRKLQRSMKAFFF
jgi:hypothetical protein